MCGIFGYISFDNTKINKLRFDKSLHTIIHRGPDCQKSLFFKEDTIALGHVRLSIIDLSETANQPMKAGNYYVIFNGEIYNYLEIKNVLVSKGYAFNTNSDTEVLVNSFDCWGEECVNKFNGMWAFSIYNTKTNSLFCSRDRFGVKPFNYYADDKRFIFSSEIKPIITYDSKLRRPNYNSIGLYVSEGIGGECSETWFENIHRLLPGHNLSVSNNKITTYRYYNYPAKKNKIQFDNAKEEFYSLFIDSVKLRMRSDVPVGITLSGGLDSSCIAAGIHQFDKSTVNTYTAHFPGFKYDENEQAQMTANYYNLIGNPVIIENENDYFNILNNIIYHLESGHNSPAIVPLWQIYKEAKKKVTVVLEGQGADELLAGYIEMFAGFYLKEKLFKLKFKSFYINLKKLVKNYSIKTTSIFYLRLILPQYVRIGIRKYVFKSENIMKGKLKNYKNNDSVFNNYGTPLKKILKESHQTTLVNLLHYGDAISMAFSIESRLPFMDYRLVDFAMSLPDEYLISEGKGKYILRESMRHILPEHINSDIKKLGFITPINDILVQNKSRLEEILLDKKTMERGIFDNKILKKYINSKWDSVSDKSYLLFRLLSVELWFRTFIDKEHHLSTLNPIQNTSIKVAQDSRMI